MTAVFGKVRFFCKLHTRASPQHIHDQIVDIGNAHAKHSLQSFRQKNRRQNHKKASAESPKTRKQNGQKTPHREKQKEISPDIKKNKAQTEKVSSSPKEADVPRNRPERTKIGIRKKIFVHAEREICFPTQNQDLGKKYAIQKKQSKQKFFHIL